MIRKLAWIVVLAAAAASGCVTGSGAIRGDSMSQSDAGSSSQPIVLASASRSGRITRASEIRESVRLSSPTL